MGKSRLAKEALDAARGGGACVHWVQATRSAASVSLGAFAAVIPAAARSDDPFELMQRAAQALRDGTSERPLVLAVDDAQWLDHASATLVLHLTSTDTAFVLVTVRSDEPCPDAIVSLWKDAGARRLEIGALGERETEELVDRMVGGPVERVARPWVAQTSRGNALYVRELMLGALADDSLLEVNGLWRLPVRPTISASLSDLVTARMAGLPARVRQALELLAFGERLRMSEMLRLNGSGSLTAAEGRGMVSIDGASDGAPARASALRRGDPGGTPLAPRPRGAAAAAAAAGGDGTRTGGGGAWRYVACGALADGLWRDAPGGADAHGRAGRQPHR